MKTVRAICLLLVALVTVHTANGQTLSVGINGVEMAKDTVAKLTSFSGKYQKGKTYLKWTAANQHVDGLYLIYRSADGVNYENIGNKQGIGVQISKEIAYYFIDKDPVFGTAHYKIVHVGNNSTCMHSEKIPVQTPTNVMVSK